MIPMDRIAFIESISGINYPEMLVHFFDQFIALKKLVEDSGSINVESSTDKSITFIANFKNAATKNSAISNISTGSVVIYGRPIMVNVEDISSTELRFILQ